MDVAAPSADAMVAAIEIVTQLGLDHPSQLRESVANVKQRLLRAAPELLAALQPAAR